MKGPPALPEAGVTGSPGRPEIISSDNKKRQHTKPPRPLQFRETSPEPEPGFLLQKWIQKGLKTAFALFRPLVSNIHPKNGIARSNEAVLSPVPTIPAKAGKTKTDPIPSVFLQTML